ncbi:MAG: exonuclease domain-containing protein, partial [Pseudomonadota bacterium]|nr:exonuclease domain-containing protein [Pseudomonadota bacterium]
MNYVFYDLETTGRSSAWDQIIQVAAILTDQDLNIIEKYEEKCRLNQYCIPNPEAILVNKISIDTLLKTNLSHYQLMLDLEKKFTEWSPAIFIGYNSIKFDEEFLRNSFFKNLLDPYITIRDKNYRFDLLDSVRATNYLYPEKIKSLISEKGNPVLKLEKIAPLNGINNFKAHDALGDTYATLELAKIIKKKASTLWKESTANKSKSYLLNHIKENPFCYVESIFGKIKLYTLSFLGEHPYYKWALCFDLSKDPYQILDLSDNDLGDFLEKSPKVIKNIKLNKSPIILSCKYLQNIYPNKSVSLEEAINKDKFIKENDLFKKRIVNYYERKEDRIIHNVDQTDILAEESIYKKFISKKD